MHIQPGDVVIVLHSNGQVSFWEQDTPEVLEYLEAVEALSTCDCPGSVCGAGEMEGWREQLTQGKVRPESLEGTVPGMLHLDLDAGVLMGVKWAEVEGE